MHGALTTEPAGRIAGWDDVTRAGLLAPDQQTPLVIQPLAPGLDLVAWAASHRGLIAQRLEQHGGILFRGFGVAEAATFERFIRAVSVGDLLEYTYRSSPRTRVHGNVYSSTEYPPDQIIPLHNENSYTTHWPLKIFFLAVQVAEQGGETPIADSRRVLKRIDRTVRDSLAARGVMYVRNYRAGIDLPWQTVFQTTDRSKVETFCRDNNIQCEWLDGGRLRTRQVCQAIASHPTTGEHVFFNQVHLFHVSSLPEAVRTALLAFGEENLPRNTYYGDASPIEPDVLDEIRRAYQAEQVSFPWQAGDILMLDNMLVAHGRARFVGPRKVLVGMSEPYGQAACRA
jgi:alpha-ketoglutarate-dependent taurine dioxygenase